MYNYLELKNTKDATKLEDFVISCGLSGRMFRKLIKIGNIKINDKLIKNKKYLLKAGDRVRIYLLEEDIDIKAQEMDLEILYEDEDIIGVNKGPFLVVHPTKNIVDNTLSNGMAYYFLKNNINSKVRIINRLDRDTSGVILFAKNSFGHQQIAKQLEDRSAIKKYYALVEGKLKKKEGIINKPIGKAPEGIGSIIREDGLESITSYKLIEEYPGGSLLELQILTGRTHQIRVHLKDLGHPIIGDSLYNKESKLINRQALHASSLTIRKTRTGELISIEAPLEKDMLNLIEYLKGN